MATDEFNAYRDNAENGAIELMNGTLAFRSAEGYTIIGPEFTSRDKSDDFATGPNMETAIANYTAKRGLPETAFENDSGTVDVRACQVISYRLAVLRALPY